MEFRNPCVVRSIFGERDRDRRKGAFRGRKGFRYGIRKAKTRPSSTVIKDLLGDKRLVGMIEEGILHSDEMYMGCTSLSFPLSLIPTVVTVY